MKLVVIDLDSLNEKTKESCFGYIVAQPISKYLEKAFKAGINSANSNIEIIGAEMVYSITREEIEKDFNEFLKKNNYENF